MAFGISFLGFVLVLWNYFKVGRGNGGAFSTSICESPLPHSFLTLPILCWGDRHYGNKINVVVHLIIIMVNSNHEKPISCSKVSLSLFSPGTDEQ